MMFDNQIIQHSSGLHPLIAGCAAVLTILAAATAATAETRECIPENGCIGYQNGMRVFSKNPIVQGVIGYQELFIDLGTTTFNDQACPHGVIRLGQNTNRIFDPAAVHDTSRQPGATGGRPIQGCAP